MKTKYKLVEKESQGLGIASMCIGILGLFISWIPIIGAPFCALGLILGLSQPNWKTMPMAISGVVLNGLFVFIQLAWFMLLVVASMGAFGL